MANLKEIRSRITSVGSTMQITSAMKMVSAAKLRRAQDAITQMRPYAEKLQSILSNVSSSLDASEGVYSAEREVKRVLLVAVTSNRGLCGAFGLTFGDGRGSPFCAPPELPPDTLKVALPLPG